MACLIADHLPGIALGYPVRTDFRPYVRLENRMFRVDMKDEAAVNAFVNQTLGETLASDATRPGLDPVKAFKAVMWFYRCGRTEDEAKAEAERVKACGSAGIDPGAGRAYDFEVDGALIVAAFAQAYGIDLTDKDTKLHWWRFRALFEGLPKCTFTQIMEYRTADLHDMPDKTKALYKQMRRYYALPGEIGGEPHYKTIEEREAAFLAKFRK
jgi:hypothetical protein